MSKNVNAFALLDDSDDESPKAPAAPPAKKETKPKTAVNNANKERRSRPNNNDRNTRGGRGPRNARDGKRTYDRRSGTGRGKEIKKGGGGGHNWGSDKNEARKNEGPVDDKNPSADADEEVVNEEVVIPEPEPEPEDNTMTMEEFLAVKSSKAAGEDLFGSKDERALEDEFSGKKTHTVVTDENFLVMGSGKSLRKKNNKKEVQKLDINFKFVSTNDSRPRREESDGRRGGGRGRGRHNDRRGGGRGRGGRGGGRRSGGRGGGLKVDDANAFPTL